MFLTAGNVLEDKQISLAMFLVEANGYAEDANRILSSELRMINRLQKKKGLNRGWSISTKTKQEKGYCGNSKMIKPCNKLPCFESKSRIGRVFRNNQFDNLLQAQKKVAQGEKERDLGPDPDQILWQKKRDTLNGIPKDLNPNNPANPKKRESSLISEDKMSREESGRKTMIVSATGNPMTEWEREEIFKETKIVSMEKGIGGEEEMIGIISRGDFEIVKADLKKIIGKEILVETGMREMTEMIEMTEMTGNNGSSENNGKDQMIPIEAGGKEAKAMKKDKKSHKDCGGHKTTIKEEKDRKKAGEMNQKA